MADAVRRRQEVNSSDIEVTQYLPHGPGRCQSPAQPRREKSSSPGVYDAEGGLTRRVRHGTVVS